MLMRRFVTYLLLAFCILQVNAKSFRGEIIPHKDLLIRISAGCAFANRVGTGESVWYSNIDKSSCGVQYGIDVLNYWKYVAELFSDISITTCQK